MRRSLKRNQHDDISSEEDSSSSEEAGTTPDILSPAGEPALVTALRAMEGDA